MAQGDDVRAVGVRDQGRFGEREIELRPGTGVRFIEGSEGSVNVDAQSAVDLATVEDGLWVVESGVAVSHIAHPFAIGTDGMQPSDVDDSVVMSGTGDCGGVVPDSKGRLIVRRYSSPYIQRFDPADGSTTDLVTSGVNASKVGLAVGIADRIFVNNPGLGTVYRYEADGTSPFKIGIDYVDGDGRGVNGTPKGIATAGKSVWVADEFLGKFTEFDQETGKYLSAFYPNEVPPDTVTIEGGLASDGTYLYAVVNDSDSILYAFESDGTSHALGTLSNHALWVSVGPDGSVYVSCTASGVSKFASATANTPWQVLYSDLAVNISGDVDACCVAPRSRLTSRDEILNDLLTRVAALEAP